MTAVGVVMMVAAVALLVAVPQLERRRQRRLALVVSLFASINRVRAVCDEWDGLSKGESPTTARIRQAIGDVP